MFQITVIAELYVSHTSVAKNYVFLVGVFLRGCEELPEVVTICLERLITILVGSTFCFGGLDSGPGVGVLSSGIGPRSARSNTSSTMATDCCVLEKKTEKFYRETIQGFTYKKILLRWLETHVFMRTYSVYPEKSKISLSTCSTANFCWKKKG